MSGHSKWSQIKRKKGLADQKRGAMFSTIVKEITVAARHGGGDINGNMRLRAVVEKAKESSMPSENIERAILRGTGQLPGQTLEEISYEGYGAGGIAVIVECLTDSRNRTTAELRHAFTKQGGNLGEIGSVGWMFDKSGVILIDRKKHPDEEKLLEDGLESGADDIVTEDEHYQIKTPPQDVHHVATALKTKGYIAESVEVSLVPKNWVTPDLVASRACMRLIQELEDFDDVQHVYSNFEPPAELLKEMEG